MYQHELDEDDEESEEEEESDKDDNNSDDDVKDENGPISLFAIHPNPRSLRMMKREKESVKRGTEDKTRIARESLKKENFSITTNT